MFTTQTTGNCAPEVKKEERPSGRDEKQKMTVFIKNLTGKTYTIENLDPNQGAMQIKNHIFKLDGIPVETQRLIYNGKMLCDAEALWKQMNLEASEKETISHGGSISLVERPLKQSKQVSEDNQANKILTSSHKLLPLEFRQFLSEKTQPQRHQMGHITNEEYWNKATGTKRAELYASFESTKVKVESAKTPSKCIVM